jgi:hypothetical protein
MYVEQNAEYLQFFLWYCDYIERWTTLPPEEKALAPKWDPESKRLKRDKSTRSPAAKEKIKLGKILDILDKEGDRKHSKSLSSSTVSSLPSIPDSVAETEGKWIPCKLYDPVFVSNDGSTNESEQTPANRYGTRSTKLFATTSRPGRPGRSTCPRRTGQRVCMPSNILRIPRRCCRHSRRPRPSCAASRIPISSDGA